MGAYNSSYVGVYVEITHHKKETRRDVLRNPVTNKVVNYKFHPDTGLASVPDVIVENVWVEPNTYPEDDWVEANGFNEDEFFSPAYTGGGKNVTTIVCNFDEFQLKTRDDLFNIDLQNVDPKDYVERFKKHYQVYLDYWSDFDVKVCFGLVNYAH